MEILFRPRTESVVFWSLLLISSFYLFVFKYTPSLDGAQHLYNANIIVELFRGNSFIEDFFKINDALVGYWSAHAILAFFNWIFPSWIAEKMILLIYLIFLPLSFRFMIKQINKHINYVSLLIIPFSQHIFFLNGYFAFCLAWIFTFLLIGYILKHYQKIYLKQFILICLLSFLCFLTHMLVFSICMFVLFSFLLYEVVTGIFLSGLSKTIKSSFRNLLLIFLAVLPALIAAVKYYLHVESLNYSLAEVQVSGVELWSQVRDLTVFVAFDHITETPYSKFLSLILFVAIIIAIISIIKKQKKKETLLNSKYIKFWTLLSFLAIVLYFSIPDTFGTGNVSRRLLVFFLFSITVVLSMITFPKIFQLVLVFSLFIYTVGINIERHSHRKHLDRIAQELIFLESFMGENSTFTALNYFPQWNNTHHHLYVGTNKALVNLKNPQCKGQFPVVWNYEELPLMLLGKYKTGQIGTHWYSGNADNPKLEIIDYLIIYAHKEYLTKDKNTEQREYLENYYILLQEGTYGISALYKFDETYLNDSILNCILCHPIWLEEAMLQANSSDRTFEEYTFFESLFLMEYLKLGLVETPCSYKKQILDNEVWTEYIKDKALASGKNFELQIHEDSYYMFISGYNKLNLVNNLLH